VGIGLLLDVLAWPIGDRSGGEHAAPRGPQPQEFHTREVLFIDATEGRGPEMRLDQEQ